VVLLDTKTGIGVAVFINAAGASPDKFADGIFKVLNSYASTPGSISARSLSDYTGAYDVDVEWGSETAVLPWKGKLMMVTLPTNDPIGSSLRLWKPTATPDLFRVDRKDDLPGIPLRFERDASGRVVRYWLNNNRREKGKY
jgi:hypothetical protein